MKNYFLCTHKNLKRMSILECWVRGCTKPLIYSALKVNNRRIVAPAVPFNFAQGMLLLLFLLPRKVREKNYTCTSSNLHSRLSGLYERTNALALSDTAKHTSYLSPRLFLKTKFIFSILYFLPPHKKALGRTCPNRPTAPFLRCGI